jgi:serine/threonine-protein kinase
MLYEMAAGRPPFDGGGKGGAYAIIAAHLQQAPPSPAEVNPRVPQELARIILKALAKNPVERFQTAEEFLAALKLIQVDSIRLNETATVALQSVHPSPLDAAPAAKDASVHSDADLDRASKDLATYIGPIAHILVRRAARERTTLNDLYRTLAQEISSAAHREQFLAGMPRASLSRSAAGTPSGGSRTSG